MAQRPKGKPASNGKRQAARKTNAGRAPKAKTASPSEPPRRPVGRPRALDAANKEKVVRFIAEGGSQNMAAAFVGVSPTTISNEAKRDPEFAERMQAAEASCYVHHVQNVKRAGKEDWRASAFMLERKYPEEFRKKTDVKVRGQRDRRPVIRQCLINNHEEAKRFWELKDLAADLRRREDELGR